LKTQKYSHFAPQKQVIEPLSQILPRLTGFISCQPCTPHLSRANRLPGLYPTPITTPAHFVTAQSSEPTTMAAHGKKFSFGRLINNAFPNFAHDDSNDVNLSPAQADQVSGTDDAGR
jgi:hypothetical protein